MQRSRRTSISINILPTAATCGRAIVTRRLFGLDLPPKGHGPSSRYCYRWLWHLCGLLVVSLYLSVVVGRDYESS
jgi:hypothetical protein